MAGLLRNARVVLNRILQFTGFQLVRPAESIYIKSYQPFVKTLKAAKEAGLSLGDYIDAKFHVPGATQETIEQMGRLGAFGNGIGRICEIGPGSGRYLNKIQQLCEPCVYEIYETDPPWSSWLEKTYHVKAREANGTSLDETVDKSVGLVHAHKVFVYLPSVIVCSYFNEMARVTRKGGWIIFDIVSEGCMTQEMLEKWISMRVFYPSMMPRDFVVDFFKRRGCSLRSSFFAPMVPGQSEYLAFEKEVD